MDYEVEFRPKAQRDLAGLSPEIARRVLAKVEVLSHDLAGDVKRLVHHTPESRLRVGDYRVLFDVVGIRIVIFRVRHRREAYDESGDVFMIELHPEILKRDGKDQFAVLPYEEFVALRDLIEDAEDLLALRKAKAEDTGEPGVSLDAMMQRFGMK